MFGISATGNFTNVLAGIEKRKKGVNKAHTKSVQDAGRAAEAMEKKLVRVKTGATRASIDTYKVSDQEVWVGPKKTSAYFLEKGRKGFCAKGARSGLKRGSVIGGTTTDHKQMLRFKGSNGKWIFRRCVGPAKPRPFVEPTYHYIRVYFPRLMQQNIHKALD